VESCILSGGTPPSASSGRCSDFLQHVDAVLLLTHANSANGIIQGQYDVSENFNDKLNFRRFFKYFSATLEQWLLRLLLSLGNGSVQSDDTFQMVIGRLATFISDNDALAVLCVARPHSNVSTF
jgi:hypothetical protein